MSLNHADLALQRPELLTSERIVGLSTDDDPEVGPDGGDLEVGQVWLHEDTGRAKYWTGSEWKLADFNQEFRLQTALLFELRDMLKGDD